MSTKAKHVRTTNIPAKLGIADHDFRLVIGATSIDYDPAKEATNRKKHGYSLEGAAFLLMACYGALFSSRRVCTSDGIEFDGEFRHQHMVEDEHGDVLFIVTTMRPNETVRVISVRKTSEQERSLFIHYVGR